MEIIRYNSDSGNRDLSSEKSFASDVTFMEILQKANELKAHLIVKTNYSNKDKPGRWYLKGFKGTSTYDEIKAKIEKNLKERKHKTRISYLIQYY